MSEQEQLRDSVGIHWVRKQALEQVAVACDAEARGPRAVRWRQLADRLEGGECRDVMIADTVDIVLYEFITAIEQELIRAHFQTTSGEWIDVGRRCDGELAGWYVGNPSWCTRYSKEVLPERRGGKETGEGVDSEDMTDESVGTDDSVDEFGRLLIECVRDPSICAARRDVEYDWLSCVQDGKISVQRATVDLLPRMVDRTIETLLEAVGSGALRLACTSTHDRPACRGGS